MPTDILMMGPMPAIETRLMPLFEVHRLWQWDDRQAFLRETGPRIRAVVTYSGAMPTDGAILSMLPELGIIANMGAGYESIDLEIARARGIVVTNAGGVNAIDVAEHAVGLMLSVARQIHAADAYARAGRWKTEGRMPLGSRLSGRRLGILGLGHIGREIARLAEAFAMPVAYHSRRIVEDVPYAYAPTVLDLARNADILIVAAPGGAETRHMVDRTVIDALGPRGIVINIGRGSVVDEQALIAALADGRLGGAGLDVFENEPEIPAALAALPNVVLQPHIAGATQQGVNAAIEALAENLVAYFSGRPVRYQVA
jgi:lactate dehydrogenase-like 2-hydroxyacid dehydrogenase